MKLSNLGYVILGLLLLLFVFLFLAEPSLILCGKEGPTLNATADFSKSTSTSNTINTTNNMIRKEALQNVSEQLAKNWVTVTKSCVEFAKQLDIPESERAKWSMRCMEGYSDSLPK
jgi:hypothetical protein